MIRHERIEDYLRRLSSGEPTPGGGATGALALAEGAGLLAMAARFSDADGLGARGDDLIADCLPAADADERGFGAVAEAYALPRDTEDRRAERSRRVQAALETAVEPPRRLLDLAARGLDLADAVLADPNPNVLSDVGAALGCLRAGLTAATVTLLTDLDPLADDGLTADLRAEIDRADALVARLDARAADVRARIVRGD